MKLHVFQYCKAVGKSIIKQKMIKRSLITSFSSIGYILFFQIVHILETGGGFEVFALPVRVEVIFINLHLTLSRLVTGIQAANDHPIGQFKVFS